MAKNIKLLHKVDIDPTASDDKRDLYVLWNVYLAAFPDGTNPVFRKRTEHDCSCCRRFIKELGDVVAINDDGSLTSIWDIVTGEAVYQTVFNEMAKFVKSCPIKGAYIARESSVGTLENHEKQENGPILKWNHLSVKLPSKFLTLGDLGKAKSDSDADHQVFKRGLDEIKEESVNTVLDLIAQNSLYRGREFKDLLESFLKLHREYHKLKPEVRDFWTWRKATEVGGATCRLRGSVIGTLLTDLSEGYDIEDAVDAFGKKVDPTNYKRTNQIVTPAMVVAAQKTITELGLAESLPRRFAVKSDISVNNILHVNNEVVNQLADAKTDVFASLMEETKGTKQNFNRVEKISIDKFISDVLPNTTKIEVFLESKHSGNMVSLIAPQHLDAPSILKWNNNFTWAYAGNMTDSKMKNLVKAAGGKVDGVLRFSLQWNSGSIHDPNDLDAHCQEPAGGDHISFARKTGHISGGVLDVDIQVPTCGKPAVENITWPSTAKMPEGIYTFYVYNYANRGGREGFSAEIEFDGQIFSFEYPKEVRQSKKVEVAQVNYSKKDGFSIVNSLSSSSTTNSKTIWGLATNQFHPVSIIMNSPNYWDLQTCIGNKHYFFILNGCINNESPNGFFNELLREDLQKSHRKVFDILGGKMRVAPFDDQLSGVGFSDTQRNSVTLRVEGAISRVLKVTF